MGFGSAGSSRSLRKTGTAVSARGQTGAAWRQTESIPSRLSSPTKDELLSAIASGQCCYCTSTATYRNLALHLGRGHGFNLAELRDEYLLPKHFPFASAEFRAGAGTRAGQRYDGTKLTTKAKLIKRELNRYGRAAQRVKSLKSPHPPRATRACVICGTVFKLYDYERQTCSSLCHTAWASQRQQERRKAEKDKRENR